MGFGVGDILGAVGGIASGGGNVYWSLLLTALPIVGNLLKNKDNNATGADDLIGQILIELNNALISWKTNQGTALRKAIAAIRDACDSFLKSGAGEK